MNAELVNGEGDESPDKQSERSTPGGCVQRLSPEPRTMVIERRPRVRLCVCVLLVLLVLLVALIIIITLAVSLCVLIVPRNYPNAFAFSSDTTPLLPFTASSITSTTYITSIIHIITTSTMEFVATTSSTLSGKFTTYIDDQQPQVLLILIDHN